MQTASAMNASRIGEEAIALEPATPAATRKPADEPATRNARGAALEQRAEVREALISNIGIIKPWLCWLDWLHPWFYHCDEVAVLETDEQGRFDTTIWYSCFGDKPDLYFWVEYSIGGAWTTVYNPAFAATPTGITPAAVR